MTRGHVMSAMATLSAVVTLAVGAGAVRPLVEATGDVAAVALAAEVRHAAPAPRALMTAPSTSVALPPLPQNTGPDATFDAPFVAPTTVAPAGTVTTTIAGGVPATSAPAGTVTLVDDLGMLQIELPAAWTDVDTTPAGPNPAISATSNWDDWANWRASGAIFVAYPTIADPLAVLAADQLSTACTPATPQVVSERGFSGIEQTFTDCGGNAGVGNVVWIVQPSDRSYSLYLNVQTITADDADAAALVRATFDVVAGASLPADAEPAPVTPFQPDESLPIESLPIESSPIESVPAPGSSDAPVVTNPPITDPGVTAPAPPTTAVAAIPAGYVELVDNTGTVRLVVPQTWTQTDGSSTQLPSGERTFTLAASTDLVGWQQRYDVPGVYVTGFEFTPDPARLLARYATTPDRECALSTGAEAFSHPQFVGVQQRWGNCDSSGFDFVAVVANPIDAQRAGGNSLVMFAQLPAGETYTLGLLTSSLLLLDKV